MDRAVRTVLVVLFSLGCLALFASGPSRDFSGRWILDDRGSNTKQLQPPDRLLSIVQEGSVLKCTATRPDGSSLESSIDLNGVDTRYRNGDESRNSKVKWEGQALLINTIVSGPSNYSILDRWTVTDN